MAARCVLTDLLVESCGHCNGAEARVREEAADGLGPGFTAQYEGSCARCGDPIGPGDTIRADGHGAYICEGCGHGA